MPMSKLDQSQPYPGIKHECLKKLQFILDGEATPDQKQEFIEKHLEVCMPCYKHYHLEMAIRDLLKSKCGNHKAPDEIVQNIKNSINSNH